jgi:hypothetical protein
MSVSRIRRSVAWRRTGQATDRIDQLGVENPSWGTPRYGKVFW